jgi:formyltetrahydrofolate-dependent phosphoribosylglycinamide formyltransferase
MWPHPARFRRLGKAHVTMGTGELVDPSILPPLDLAGLALERGSVRTAVLLSGTGRTLENLIRVIAAGELPCAIAAVVSSRPNVRGLDIAAAAGLPSFVFERRHYPSDETYSDEIYRTLRGCDVELILLAGFLRKLVVAEPWEGRILNIHPALLPDAAAASGHGFYGERVHAAVLAGGASQSGATVHVVTNEYDAGPVVMRAIVPVLPDDTPASLAARVFEAECRLYPAAIRRYIADHPELFGS